MCFPILLLTIFYWQWSTSYTFSLNSFQNRLTPDLSIPHLFRTRKHLCERFIIVPPNTTANSLISVIGHSYRPIVSIYPEIDSSNQQGCIVLSVWPVKVYSLNQSAAFDFADVYVFNTICNRLSMNPWIQRVLVNFMLIKSAYVSIGQSNSPNLDLKVGCAQGSTLGQKIFNIYVSELWLNLKLNIQESSCMLMTSRL